MRTGPVRFDQANYRARKRIERRINRPNQSRRSATRYEQRAANYLVMVTLVAMRVWLEFAHTP